MMKWCIDDDEGSYDRVYIRETELRAGRSTFRTVGIILSPAEVFQKPTDADREEMLQTAREIVELHNAKETG